jgi:hypothetical protein
MLPPSPRWERTSVSPHRSLWGPKGEDNVQSGANGDIASDFCDIQERAAGGAIGRASGRSRGDREGGLNRLDAQVSGEASMQQYTATHQLYPLYRQLSSSVCVRHHNALDTEGEGREQCKPQPHPQPRRKVPHPPQNRPADAARHGPHRVGLGSSRSRGTLDPHVLRHPAVERGLRLSPGNSGVRLWARPQRVSRGPRDTDAMPKPPCCRVRPRTSPRVQSRRDINRRAEQDTMTADSALSTAAAADADPVCHHQAARWGPTLLYPPGSLWRRLGPCPPPEPYRERPLSQGP